MKNDLNKSSLEHEYVSIVPITEYTELCEAALEDAFSAMFGQSQIMLKPNYLIVPEHIFRKLRETEAREAWKTYWRGKRMLVRAGLWNKTIQ